VNVFASKLGLTTGMSQPDSGRTVTWNVQLLVPPQSSVARHVTVWLPTAKRVPEAGVQLAVGLRSQLSVALAL
jgi:hypothetical protein